MRFTYAKPSGIKVTLEAKFVHTILKELADNEDWCFKIAEIKRLIKLTDAKQVVRFSSIYDNYAFKFGTTVYHFEIAGDYATLTRYKRKTDMNILLSQQLEEVA